MPEAVEWRLVQLIDAANSILPRYDRIGDYLPIERLGLGGFRPTKLAIQLHRAQFYPEKELELLRSVFVKKNEVRKWVRVTSEALPEFWFEPEEVAESKALIARFHGSERGATRKDQQDKRKCQEIARRIWGARPQMTIAEMCRQREILIDGNGKAYSGKNTLRSWLSKVAPPTVKGRRGRPRKQAEIRSD